MRPAELELFHSLLASAGEAMARTAFAVTRDRQLAEDVCQEACLALYRALRESAPIHNYRAWLHRVVVRKAAAILRARQTPDGHPVSLDALPHRPPLTGGWGQDPAGCAAVRDALERLPSGLRDAVTLKVLNGLSYGDVAEALGCSKETAWRWVQGALAELGRWFGADPRIHRA